MPSPHLLGAEHGPDRVFDDIGDDTPLLRVGGEDQDASARHDAPARSGIEPSVSRLRMGLEIAFVLFGEAVDPLEGTVGIEQSGEGFDPDDMFGGQSPAVDDTPQSGAAGEGQGLRGLDRAGFHRRAPQSGDRFGESRQGLGGDRFGLRRGEVQRGFRFQILLGPGDDPDHPVVGAPGVVVKGKDAVMHEDNPLQSLPVDPFGQLSHGPGQFETGHDVIDDQHPFAVELLQPPPSVGGVGDGHHRIGMGMIHVGKGDQGMEDRFDGGIGGVGVTEGLSLQRYHLRIAELLPLCHLQQSLHRHGGESGGFDGVQVPAAAFDIEGVVDLDGGVAPAVEDQVGFLPQETGGIDPKFQRGESGGGLRVETVEHGGILPWLDIPLL